MHKDMHSLASAVGFIPTNGDLKKHATTEVNSLLLTKEVLPWTLEVYFY